VKKEPLYTVGRNTTIMESRREIPWKAKNRTAIWSSDTTPGNISEGT
jgi:hypothetical protein